MGIEEMCDLKSVKLKTENVKRETFVVFEIMVKFVELILLHTI